MKTRNGFVSNSSSTSFIVAESQKEQALKDGLTLVKVSDIIEALKVLEPVDYMVSYGSVHYYLERLEKIKDCYLSEPYDRDWAYQRGFTYGEFEGDL